MAITSAALPTTQRHIIRAIDVPSKTKHNLSRPLNVVKFNSNGQYILSAGNDKRINLFNVYSGAHVKSYEAHGYEITDLAVSFDNARFTSVGGDKPVYFWDVAAGVTIRRFAGHTQRVNAVAFNSDSSVIISGSFDATVRLWDTKSNSHLPIQVLEDAKDSISSVFVHSNLIVTGSVDGTVRTYDLRRGLLTKDLIGHPVTSVRYSRDGQILLVSSLDSTVRMLDNDNGGLLQEFKGHKGSDYRIPSLFNDDEGFVASGSEDGRIIFWDVNNGRIVHDLKAHDGKVISGLDIHANGAHMASCGSDGTITLWSN